MKYIFIQRLRGFRGLAKVKFGGWLNSDEQAPPQLQHQHQPQRHQHRLRPKVCSSGRLKAFSSNWQLQQRKKQRCSSKRRSSRKPTQPGCSRQNRSGLSVKQKHTYTRITSVKQKHTCTRTNAHVHAYTHTCTGTGWA